ncbi:hypothetical protein M513_03310 [Trichuris suis]|uniref:ZU5 domain-containing protein n=1 Tax=Trichuris suis TaxID=68888 RepID=A0A085MF75_9BILA|nr:hypothetical protein M513_03310 [Trichuris suis]
MSTIPLESRVNVGDSLASQLPELSPVKKDDESKQKPERPSHIGIEDFVSRPVLCPTERWPALTNAMGENSASFLRAARAGNVTELVELLKSGTDINTCNANGLNALHIASKEGHADVVEELLTRGARVDAATKKGNTALHIASLAGQMEVVELLINHGANPNVQSQDGFTPLYMAAQENHDGVVVYLLQHGANQSLATEEGFTPLAVALQQGHDRVVAILLENDTRGKVRLPALHIAAKKDDTKAAALLLQSDHNPDVTSKSGFTPLHIAAHYGNENIAKMLLEKGANVNFMARHNITPLHVAAKWGRANLVALLLAHGAVIDCRTRDLLTPLHCAARSGHDQIVDLLLEKGAPISAKSKNGLAPLHTAAQGDHVDTARILLYHRAPVDEVTVDYLTPLHIAAHYGHVQTAKLLLDRNADPNSRALNGFTPLHVACKKNRIKVVELLLKYQAALEATTESGLTPLHVAAFMGCMNIVVYLMQHGANPDVVTIRGETPLHLATRAYQTDVVRILLRNGATVDATAREGQTPLHIASRLGNADIVMLLLQHGAKVDAPTRDQYTPLHIAAKEGQEEVVALLLDHGASHELQTSKGFKPIHLAAKYGNYAVVEALLEKGADVDAQGKNQVTPLHVAAHYNHEKVALLLLEHKASPRAAAKNGYTPLHIVAKKNQLDIAPVLLEYQADVNAESKASLAGFTPLHLASQEGHVGMVLFLLEHGAEVNAQARNGLTPMHLCAQDDRVEVAQVLKDHGANLSPQTKAGYTPLHVACHFGQINMVKFLLENGADLNASTSLGYTPLHQAAQQGHGIIVKLLLDEGASPNVLTTNGQTPLSIAQKLGYVSVVETLRTITETTIVTETTTITEERYNVQSPETMQETFISESEDEGDDAYARSLERDLDGLSSLRPFSDLSDVYLNGTSQFMDTSGFGSLRRHSPSSRSSDFYSSLPRRQHHHRPGDGIGKLRYAEEGGVASSLSFEKEMHHPIEALQDESLLPMDKSLEAEQLQLENLIRKVQEQPFTPSGSDYRLEDAFSPDNVDTSRLALHSGFLVSFLVDARGGAMRGCRHSGVRIIVPPRKAPMPMRITCRYLRREKLIHPPPLNEGEALASRILEMGPAGAKFLGPVIIEVPHFASLRGREREIVLMRSEDGEHWKEHALEATEDAVQEVLNESFNPEELSQIEDLNTTRITRILTNDFPQYFALVTRIRQEVHAVGPEGGMIASTVVPQVQALFPEGALTKTIKVSLQAQAIPQDLVNKLHGNRVAVSPIVTVEPRRRKFHKPITLCIPLPQSTNKGMITQYSAQTGQDPPTLRLLCSIVGGTAPAQWEDITGTTQLTFSNDNVSFTTTVSARFWLMDCQTPRESARMAQEIYNDGIVVPYMAKFVVFARRLHPTEGQLRLFCVTDDKEDKTLERQEHYQEIAKSRDVEVLSGRPQYLEFVGNLVPVTKSGEQLSMHFFPFQENRLMFYLKLRDLDDPNAAAAGRVAVMRESRQRSENLPPQHPICTLAITLPNYSGTPPSDAYLIEGRKEVPPSEKAPVYESSWESRRTFTPNYVHYQSTPKVPSVESTYIAPYTQAIAQEEVAPIRPERHVSNILPVKEETNVSQEYVLLKTSDNLEDAEPYLYESPVVERKGVEIVEEPTASPIISEPASSEVGFAFEPQRESLESSLASSEQSSDTIVAPPRDKGARLASKTARLSYKEGSSSEASTLSARSPTAPDEISSEWTADQLSPFVQSLSYEESNLADVQENETAIGRVDLQVNLKRSADNAVMSGTIPDAALVTRGVAEVRRMRGDKFPPSEEVPSSELRYDEEDGKWTAETSYGAVETKTMGDDWRLSPGSEKQVTLNVRLRRGEDQFNSVAIIPEGSRVAPTATDVQRRTGEVNELRLEELEASKVPLERRLVEEVGDKDRRDAVEGPVGDSSVRLVPLDRSSASDSSFVPLQDELEASVLEVSGLSLEDDEIDPSAVPLRRSLTPRAGEEPMGGYHLVGERRVPANGIICHASSEDLSSQQTAPSAQPLLLDSPLLYSGEPKLVELPDESCVERSVHVDQPTLGPWSGDRVRKEEDISYEEKNRQELWTRSPNALVMGTYLGQPVVAGLVSSPVEVECIEGGHLLLTGDTPFVKLHLDRDLSEKAKVGSVPKDSDVIVRECQEYLALLDEGQTTPSPGSRVQPSPVVGGLFLGSPVVQSTFTVVDDRGAPLRSLQDLPDVKTSQETETVEEGFIEGDGRVVSTKKITRVVTTTRTMTTGNDGPKVQETRVTTQQVMDGSGRPVVVEEIVSSPGPSSGGVAPNEPPRQQPLIRLKVDDAVFNGVLDKNAHIKLTPAEAGEGGGGGGGNEL